ncbi:hypothetical protein DXG01_007350, partial [Tephrocybe rancida]
MATPSNSDETGPEDPQISYFETPEATTQIHSDALKMYIQNHSAVIQSIHNFNSPKLRAESWKAIIKSPELPFSQHVRALASSEFDRRFRKFYPTVALQLALYEEANSYLNPSALNEHEDGENLGVGNPFEDATVSLAIATSLSDAFSGSLTDTYDYTFPEILIAPAPPVLFV